LSRSPSSITRCSGLPRRSARPNDCRRGQSQRPSRRHHGAGRLPAWFASRRAGDVTLGRHRLRPWPNACEPSQKRIAIRSSIERRRATGAAPVSIGISINIEPPPLPVYEQPPIPEPGYLWVPGYWAWNDDIDDYYWVPGTWNRRRPVGGQRSLPARVTWETVIATSGPISRAAARAKARATNTRTFFMTVCLHYRRKK
jgi:WXXGXW repeat (2 copies)